MCVSLCQSVACLRDYSSPVQAGITKFGSEVQNTLVKKILIVFGWLILTFKVKFDLRKSNFTSFSMWKLNFLSTHPNTVVHYMFYTKFHSPRPIFYFPSSKCTPIGERVSISFPHWVWAHPHNNSSPVQARITKFGSGAKYLGYDLYCFEGWLTLTIKVKFNLKIKTSSYPVSPPEKYTCHQRKYIPAMTT